MADLTIKQLTTMAEMKAISEIERTVWNMTPLPVHQTFTAAQNGGIILAAYDGETAVGFLYSFPGFQNGHIYLCSHMLGVHPDRQQQRIGLQLKQKQYELAYQQGFSEIVWTYDPLLSVNAYLNLHKLGAYTVRYYPDYYGDMDDALNMGLPTDRFLIRWPVTAKAATDLSQAQFDLLGRPSTPLVTSSTEDSGYSVLQLSTMSETFVSDIYRVPIPADFPGIKVHDPELARQWRLQTRDIFMRLLAEGFAAVDLMRTTTTISHYIFIRKGTEL